MLPSFDLLMDKVILYNNLAQCGVFSGRLSSSLEIYPSPRIVWEFEVIGDEVKSKGQIRGKLPMDPILGYNFKIEESYISFDSHDFYTPAELISGITFKAFFGNPDNPAHYFEFYLPNTRFQQEIWLGQKIIENTISVDDRELGSSRAGRIIEAQISANWKIRIRTNEEALNWLDSRNQNIGIRITGKGELYPVTDEDVASVNSPTMTTTEAIEELKKLCIQLSFINGGFIGPLFIKSYRNVDKDDPTSFLQDGIAITYQATPLERLGGSWCTFDSDLSNYLSCFPVFNRMLTESPWNDALIPILAWYFQAIQPESRQIRGKQWVIVANAAGAALERLGYTILVLEENDEANRERADILFSGDRKKINKYPEFRNQSPTEMKIKMLLQKAGLTLQRGCWDTNMVASFVKVRNEATHPKKSNMDGIDINQSLDKAIQWIEEVMLWRIGYSGHYLSREPNNPISIPHRYDLKTRNNHW